MTEFSKCPDCAGPGREVAVESYVDANFSREGAVTLHGINVFRCPRCGDMPIYPRLSGLIDAFKATGLREFTWDGQRWLVPGTEPLA